MPVEHRQPPYSIEPFDSANHDRAAFGCGSSRVDNYLRLTAKKQQRNDHARIWVAVPAGQTLIAGFYAVAAYGIRAQELSEEAARQAPNHGMIPVIYLSVLGVDTQHQGKGLGDALLTDALERALMVSDNIGVAAVILDVLDDGGEAAIERRTRFYHAQKFQQFPSMPMRMFLMLATARAAFGRSADR